MGGNSSYLSYLEDEDRSNVPPVVYSEADSDKKLGHYLFPPPCRPELAGFSLSDWWAENRKVAPLYEDGFFGKRLMSLVDHMSYQDQPITESLTRECRADPELNTLAVKVFKLLLIYQGDYVLENKYFTRAALVDQIVQLGLKYPDLRNEIYIQICKQTTRNFHSQSLIRAWTVFTVMSFVFAPTASLLPRVLSYLVSSYDGYGCIKTIAPFCYWRLLKTVNIGATKRAPPLHDIEHLRMGRVSSTHVLFGGSIVYICALEKLEGISLAVPRILPRLLGVLEANGALTTPRVFTSPANKKEVAKLRYAFESARFEIMAAEKNSLLRNPVLVATVLKRWFKCMSEPLFPDHLYPVFLESVQDQEAILNAISRLPAINFAVLDVLMTFLARVVLNRDKTKTSTDDLAKEFYPVLMRCPSNNVLMAEALQHRHCCQFIMLIIKSWIRYATKRKRKNHGTGASKSGVDTSDVEFTSNTEQSELSSEESGTGQERTTRRERREKQVEYLNNQPPPLDTTVEQINPALIESSDLAVSLPSPAVPSESAPDTDQEPAAQEQVQAQAPDTDQEPHEESEQGSDPSQVTDTEVEVEVEVQAEAKAEAEAVSLDDQTKTPTPTPTENETEIQQEISVEAETEGEAKEAAEIILTQPETPQASVDTETVEEEDQEQEQTVTTVTETIEQSEESVQQVAEAEKEQEGVDETQT